jgi:hypothetical protein
MKCPTSQTDFYPHMSNTLVGKNRNNASVFLYYQLCPECKEPVIRIIEATEGEAFLSPDDINGLILLTRDKRTQNATHKIAS